MKNLIKFHETAQILHFTSQRHHANSFSLVPHTSFSDYPLEKTTIKKNTIMTPKKVKVFDLRLGPQTLPFITPSSPTSQATHNN